MPGEGLDDVARQLRQRMGVEFRDEAEEGERLAAQAALRRRRLVDVAVEAGERGWTLSAVLPGRVFTGAVAHAAGDLLTLATSGGEVHVNLAGAVVLRSASAAPTDPRPRPDGATSFKARLYELEMARAEVEVGGPPFPEGLRGRLRAVAIDHVLVDDPDGGRWAAGLAAVHYVRVAGRSVT